MNSYVIEKTFELPAPPKKVFDALTKDIFKWWKREYLIGEKKVKKLVCEPKLGGKMVEVWGPNEGTIWGTVTELQKNARIEICGTIGSTGACWSKIGYELEAKGKNATILKFTQHSIGTFDSDTGMQYDQGWDLIFDELRKFCSKKSK